jgi:hypothetical protein
MMENKIKLVGRNFRKNRERRKLMKQKIKINNNNNNNNNKRRIMILYNYLSEFERIQASNCEKPLMGPI